MDIGIIGAGHIGGSLTRRLAGLGHAVRVSNSRAPKTLADLAGETGATAVWAREAATDADLGRRREAGRILAPTAGHTGLRGGLRRRGSDPSALSGLAPTPRRIPRGGVTRAPVSDRPTRTPIPDARLRWFGRHRCCALPSAARRPARRIDSIKRSTSSSVVARGPPPRARRLAAEFARKPDQSGNPMSPSRRAAGPIATSLSALVGGQCRAVAVGVWQSIADRHACDETSRQT